MALSGFFKKPDHHFRLVHHSDRGIQYCAHEYVKILVKNNKSISMTEKGDPLENPIAERVNGIIKEEYLQDFKVNNITEALQVLKFVVILHNADRPHNSIGNLIPGEVHEKNLETEKLWKNYYNKKTNIVNQF
ncbi:MAG: transposase [Bacteroidales bacterium]|nr:transposase [Bacteroidales bacterium]